MNGDIVNKWAMGLAVFSFGFLSIGSFLFGATATTSALRGFSGGILFGILLWLVGVLIDKGKNPMDDNIDGEGNVNLGSPTVKVQSTDLQDK